MSKTILKKNKIWFNVHLVLTFICCIPLLIVAVTGSFISYHDEIIDAINEEKFNIGQADKERLKPSEIFKKIQEQVGELDVDFISVRNGENNLFSVSGRDKNANIKSYIINPYSGEIIGESIEDSLMNLVFELHTNLGFGLVGNKTLSLIGKHIVAASTIALILLLFTGVIIYYPYFKSKFIKAFRINFRARGYMLFYQLHSSLGIWSVIVLLAICVSGLYFSYEWVAKFTNSMFGERQIYEKGKSSERGGFLVSDENRTIELDRVFKIFQKENGENFKVFNIIIEKDSEIYNARYTDIDAKEGEINAITIDGKNDKILKHTRFYDMESQTPKSFKIYKTVLDIHSGQFFGDIGRFIFCLASFLIVVFTVTGFWMMLMRINR